MTIDISNNAARVNYTVASGVTQTSFSVPFEFFNDGDLSVYVDNVLKTITTHYTVSGGDGSTGTITMSVTGAAGGSTVVISRSIAIERTSDFVTGVDINRAALNTQLDTLTAIAADNQDKANRSITAPNSEVNPVLELPNADTRKGKLIGFNETTGNIELSATLADGNTLASISGDIATLADIEDGTDATDAIQTVAGISSDVTTAASNITEIQNASANAATATTRAAEAATSATNAATSATNAATSETNAATSETNAATSASTATTQAGISTTKAGEAAASAAAALASEGAASTSETNAANSAANSSNSATLSEASRIASVAAQAAAETAETNAETAETNAAASASAASTSASNASTSETNAASSAASASTDAGTATTKAGEAATSATAAASSASSAQASKDAALAALDSFDDRYLGQKTADPTVDNDGDALVSGALYFNTTDDIMKVYDGSLWVAAYASLSGAMFGANNLSDVADAAGSRANLGLGTAATTASTDYATAAQGALADSAIQPNDTPTFAGINTTGNATFGDNDKAIFGAGSDLQIYHDPATGTSYINESGPSNLQISATNFLLRDASGLNSFMYAIDGAEVGLFHNNTQRLTTTSTGIDVTGNATFADNGKAIFGAGSDLQIYHDGSDSFIDDAGTGSLYMRSNSVVLGKYTGEVGLVATADGSVDLYYNDVKKLATTSTGIDVTGEITADGIALGDNQVATFGASDDLQIYHDGNSKITDVGTGKLELHSNGTGVTIQKGATEYMAQFLTDGAVQLYHDNGQKFATKSNGVTVTGEMASDSISLNDNAKANFGNSNDLQIYHDGTQSIISEAGTGNLSIRSSAGTYIQKYDGTETMAYFAHADGVYLYFNNSLKFQTTSSGITVTGTINGGDLRGEAWVIGRDTNDYINVGTTQIEFILDGNTDMLLQNDGDLHVDGNVVAYSTTVSDERLKTDIVKIDSALDKVDQINGYTFTYTADGKKSAGVIAQEVEKVLPSAITESTLPLKMGEDDKTEYKTVQYDQLIGLLVEAVKELKSEIAELKGQ